MYLLTTENNDLLKFPYSVKMLRADVNQDKTKPRPSIPKKPSDEFLASHNVQPVVLADKPAHNELIEIAQRDSVPVLNGDVWQLGWTVTAKLEAEQKKSIEARIVRLMIEKQDGGIVFNGLPVATDSIAVADLSGGKQKGRVERKVVTRAGKGAKSNLNQVQFDALFDAVENYRYSIMAYAYDLLESLEPVQDFALVDIEAGWPSNEITL